MPDGGLVMWKERLARVHPSTDRRFLRPGFLGDRSSVSGKTRSPLASDTTVFLFFPSHLQNWNRKCWISGDEIAAGWQEGERMDEMQQRKPGNMLDLHFATEDSDSCPGSQFWALEVFASVWKKKESTRELPQLSRRCPQRKIETDCWVSEGSVKNVSGGLDYGTRQRLRAGRSKPNAPKAPPKYEKWATSAGGDPFACRKDQSLLRTTCWDLGATHLRGKQEREFQTKPVASVLVPAWPGWQSADGLWVIMNTVR